MWLHQVTGLWVVFGFSVTRLVGTVKTASLCRVIRAVVFIRQQLLPHLCLVRAPSPARQDKSVLNADPRDQLWDPPPALLWEVGLSPHSPCQSLCFSQSLLGPRGSSGKLLVTLLLLSAFAALPSLDHWEFGTEYGSFPHPHSPGRFSVPPPPLLSVSDYSSLCMFFSFTWGGGIRSAQGLHWIIFLGGR
jgi:hypothetical protein